jgi:hypothetical protein
MNGTELFKADGTATGVWYCEKCRVVHRAKAHADSCCAVKLCECGAVVAAHSMKCEACWDKEVRNRAAERFHKAAKLATWDGPVWAEGCGDNDGFFGSMDEFMEWMDDRDADESTPAYVWTCDKKPVVQLDSADIIERATEDAYEDFDSGLLFGLAELDAALKAFNELNKGFVNWIPNYTRAVVIGAKDAATVQQEEAR